MTNGKLVTAHPMDGVQPWGAGRKGLLSVSVEFE